jgi:putative hemolysin
MFDSFALALSLILLFGSSMLTGMYGALQRLGHSQAEACFKETRHLFFFQHFFKWLFREKKWDGLFFCIQVTKNLLQLAFAITAFLFLQTFQISFALCFLLPIAIALLADFLMTLLSLANLKFYFKFFGLFTSIFLLITAPLTTLLFKIFRAFIPSHLPSFRIRDKMLEVLSETESSKHLDIHDQKLLLSVASFKDRIAREVMVPRIDVFSLPSDTTIHEAAQSFLSEGYSRIPVYRESVDNVIGVLLYKDVLNIYAKASSPLDIPIESLVKPVLYSPETKKISHLLQEFRSKQIHLAIVVDEYGGTEGIVTIEDILEELVGEIADEYDSDEDILFTELPGGGWVVDARMSIIDIEEELGIKIQQSPEYDTIGGYIFHRAGSIPSKGWRIHHDAFDLEILSSDERSIEKIRITPHRD